MIRRNLIRSVFDIAVTEHFQIESMKYTTAAKLSTQSYPKNRRQYAYHQIYQLKFIRLFAIGYAHINQNMFL